MVNFEELEESLTRLDSVDAVRIVGAGRQLAEIHILAAPEKPAKQVVRDVQSLAMARYGESIDRRIISVVQLAADIGKQGKAERPIVIGIREEPNGARVNVHVTLAWQDEEYVGTSVGPTATSARLRLIGEATLHALEAVYPKGPPLALDAIGPSSIGMRTVVIAVVLSSEPGRGEEVSVGAVLSEGDPAHGAVRAVLDALNRRLPSLSR